MKKIKMLISVLILMFCVGMIGEVYQNYLIVIEDEFYVTTFYMQPDTQSDKMLEDIYEAAKQNNVSVFKIQHMVKNEFQTQLMIYADKDTKHILEKSYFLQEGDFKSLFSGRTTIKYVDYFSAKSEYVENDQKYYLIGDRTGMTNMKEELVERYAGSFPKAGSETNRSHMKNMLYLTWMIGLFVIVLLSLFDSIFQSKENMVRISLGEKVQNIILKNVGVDTLGIIVCYIICRVCYFGITGLHIFVSEMNVYIMILLIINSLAYLTIYRVDIKKSFSNVPVSNKVLLLNYIIKVITTIGVVLVLATNFMVIQDAYHYYQQKDFFDEYKDYSYVELKNGSQSHIEGTAYDRIISEFYYKNYKTMDIIALSYQFELEDRPCVCANGNSWKYLQKNIPEIDVLDHADKNFILVPQDYTLTKENEEFLAAYFHGEYQIVPYQTRIKLVMQNQLVMQGSELVDSPVIWYDGRQTFTNEDCEEELFFTLGQLLVKTDSMQLEDYFKENNIEIDYTLTNVKEAFTYHWLILKRMMMINIILSILFLVLDGLISITIIHLEYQVNAIELALKKIMGYTVFSRNKALYGITVGCNLFCLVSCLIISFVMKMGDWNIIIAEVFILTLLQSGMIALFSYKEEKENIQKTLKGGCL